jgi:hypothetical protein
MELMIQRVLSGHKSQLREREKAKKELKREREPYWQKMEGICHLQKAEAERENLWRGQQIKHLVEFL